jgi:superfamily II DNA or RNA helicase
MLVAPTVLTLYPKLADDLLRLLRREISYTLPGVTFSSAYQSGVWDGRYYLFKTKTQTAPSGCYKRVAKFLVEQGHEVSVEFEKQHTPNGTAEINGITLMDFQVEAVERAIEDRYCIVSAPVRSGKTAILASFLKRVGAYPSWVVTSGIDLVIQTCGDIQRYLGVPVGTFSESEYNPQEITVSSYQALISCFSDRGKHGEALKNGDIYGRVVSDEIRERNDRVKRSIKEARVLILDECHHALSKKNGIVVSAFSNVSYRIGLSGTPKPDKVPWVRVESVIGHVASKVKFDKLIKSGRIVQPVVILYDLPYSWFAQNMTNFMDIRQQNIVENVYRNRFIVEIVANLKKEGKTVFIMINRIEHGEILRDLIPDSVFVQGSISGETRKGLYAALQSKKLSCIITTCTKEGLNLPRLDAVINGEGLYSDTPTIQKMRSLTSVDGKEVGLVIDFLDKGKYLKRHGDKRKKRYNLLPGFIVKEKKVPGNYYEGASRW